MHEGFSDVYIKKPGSRPPAKRRSGRREDSKMKTVTKWYWHGSGFLLLILSLSIVLIPFAVVHFITNLVMVAQDEATPEVDPS